MAVYSVVASDGKKYNIEGPAGLSKEEAKRIADHKLSQQAPKRAQADMGYIEDYDADYGIGDEIEEFFKGIPRGAVNIGELAALGISEGLGADQETRDKIKGIAESARSPFTRDTGAGGETVVGDLIGEGLGSVIPMGLMAMAGPLGLGAAAATGVAAGAGEATNRAREAGATESQVGEAGVLGSFIGATEILPISRILGRGGKEIVNRFLRYGAAAGEEGLQEAAAAAAQNLVEQHVYNPEAEILNIDVAKEGGVGASVGAIAQALVDLATRGKRRTAADQRAAEEQAAREAAVGERVSARAEELGLGPDGLSEGVSSRAQNLARELGYGPDGLSTDESRAREEQARKELELEQALGMADRSVTDSADRARALVGEAKNAELDARYAANMAKLEENIARSRAAAERSAQEARDLINPPPPAPPTPPKAEPQLPPDMASVLERARATTDRGTRAVSDRLAPPAPEPELTPEQRASKAVQASTERARQDRERLRGMELNRNRQQPDMFPEQQMGRVGPARPPQAPTTPTRPNQPDMIEQDEAAQIEEMYAAEQAAQQKAMEREQVAEQARTGVATTMKDQDVAAAETGRSAQARMGVINSVLDRVPTADQTRLERAASAELRRQGYAAGALTDAERAAIAKKSYERQEAAPTTDTGADTASMEALIPEKGARVKQGTQLGGTDGQVDRTDTTPDVGRGAAPSQQVPMVRRTGSQPTSTTAPVVPDRQGLGSGDGTPRRPRGRTTTPDSTLKGKQDGDKQKQPTKAGKPTTKQAAKKPTISRPAAEQAKQAAKADPEKAKAAKARQAKQDAQLKQEAQAKTTEDGQKRRKRQYTFQGKQYEGTQYLTDAEIARIESGGVKDEYTNLVLEDRSYDTPLDPQTKYTNYAPQNLVPDEDIIPLFNLVQKVDAKSKTPAGYARRYFASHTRAIDGIVDLAFESQNGALDGRSKDTVKQAEAWVRANLSPQSVALLDKYQKRFKSENAKAIKNDKARASKRIEDQLVAKRKLKQKELARQLSQQAKLKNANQAAAEQQRKQVAQQTKSAEQAARDRAAKMEDRAGEALFDNDWLDSTLDTFAKYDSDNYLEAFKASTGADAFRPLHPEVQEALKAGDLMRAMRLLDFHLINPELRGIAKKLADTLARMNTKVVVKDADAAIGESKTALGVYRSLENLIELRNSPEGMTAHTLLHEVTHAVTVHTIDTNPNMPAVKRLAALYNNLKPIMGDNWYAFKNLKEFVAEAYTNPEFQRALDEYSVTPEANTAWEKFLDSVIRIVQKVTGKDISGWVGRSESLRDTTVRAVENIIQPWDGGVDHGVYYNREKIMDTRGALDDITPERLTIAQARIESAGKSTRRILKSLLPLSSIASMIERKYGKDHRLTKLTREFEVLTREQSAAMGKRQAQLEVGYNKVIRPWMNSVRKSPEKQQLLDDLVSDSTTNQVDPSLSPAEARTKYANDQGRLDYYNMLRARWDRLGKEGQDVYRTMRNTYNEQYSEILRVLEGSSTSEGVEEASRRVFKEALETIRKAGRLEPYFPLRREGDFVLSYTDPSNKEYYQYAYTTEAERRAAKAQLKAQFGATFPVEEFVRSGVRDYTNAPPTSFMYQLGKVLDSNDVQPEVVDQIMRLYMDAMPEKSILKGFQERKGTPGAIRDSVNVFRKQTINLANQLTQMEYGAKISKWEGKLNDMLADQTADTANDPRASEWAQELQDHAKYARNPRVGKAAKLLTGVGFGMTLGLNVSSALVNLAQIPTVMMPYYAGRYGYKATGKAFKDAGAALRHSGRTRKVWGVGPNGPQQFTVNAAYGLDNYDFADMASVPEHIRKYATLARIADEQGQLNRSIAYDVLDVDGLDSTWSRFNAVSGFMFHHMERINRQTGLMAGYDLHLQKLKADPATRNLPQAQLEEMAAQEAINLVSITNGDAHAAGAPRIAQNDVGRVAFLFKRYGVTMYYLLGKTMKDAVVGKSPEIKAEARKQFAGMFGASAVLAGAQGMPLYGLMAMLYDLLWQDDGEEDFDTIVRQYVGDDVFSGGLNALTGWEVGTRVGLSDLIFRDPFMAHEKTAVQIAMEFIGGPVLGIVNSWERGVTQIHDGETMKGIQSLSPAFLRSWIKAGDMVAEGTISTIRGDKVMDVDAADIVGQAIGFTPAEYALQMRNNAVISDMSRAASETKSKLNKKLYVALRLGNTDDVQEVIADIQRYNRRWPEFAITTKSINDSLQAHERTTGEMYHGIRVDPRMMPRVQRLMQNIEN